MRRGGQGRCPTATTDDMRNSWLVSLILIAACDKPADTAAPAAATPTAQAATAPENQPAPTSQPAATAPTGPASAGGLTWSDAAPLVRRAPKNSMRAAEYGVEGDERSELSVFYFGPEQAGQSVVEPNITRWLGQLAQPDGSDTAQKAKRSELKVGTMVVNMVEAAGTFAGGMSMPGAPALPPLPDAVLLGAIANGPQGAVFFKLVGPRAAVERARPGLLTMLNSLHAE